MLFANAPKASPDQLKSFQKVELDIGAFQQCLSSGKYQTAVQDDIDEGTRAGVTGTPACFINGRPISGAQLLERFMAIIEEGLIRTR